jgi:inorganic pyrophosphatase
MALLSEGLTQILIPVAALIGLAFALLQWFLVSKVKVSYGSGDGNDYKDKLIPGEEEEGIDNFEVTMKCAEIQNAISEGELSPFPFPTSFFYLCFKSLDYLVYS